MVKGYAETYETADARADLIMHFAKDRRDRFF